VVFQQDKMVMLNPWQAVEKRNGRSKDKAKIGEKPQFTGRK
jgi:hypothetical protein